MSPPSSLDATSSLSTARLRKYVINQLIGPRIRAKMNMARKRLPVTLKVSLLLEWHVALFGNSRLELNTLDRVHHLLSDWSVRTFRLGTEARLTVPLIIYRKDDNTFVKFRYAVFNKHNELQWPVDERSKYFLFTVQKAPSLCTDIVVLRAQPMPSHHLLFFFSFFYET